MRVRVWGRALEVTRCSPSSTQVAVTLNNGEVRNAIAYESLCGPVEPGDRVLLNTFAVEMGLGTGGLDFVIATDRDWDSEPIGHIVKLRYTPLQTPVLECASPESPHHDLFLEPGSLDELPIVCAELHSMVPAIAAGFRASTGAGLSITYVMTDGAALHAGFSRLIPAMKDAGLVDSVITSGQAVGGDIEAVNIFTALIAAKSLCNANVVIVAQGPGNAGTGTPLGFSGIDQGVSLNAVSSLNGTPICAARISFADSRSRHFGLSHHTVTVLERIALGQAKVPMPLLDAESSSVLAEQLKCIQAMNRHQILEFDSDPGLNWLRKTGIRVTTMGRGIDRDEAFFRAAISAGVCAAHKTA